MNETDVIKKNSFFNYFYILIFSVTNFIVSPLAAHILGKTDFGMWKTLSKVVDCFSFTDGRTSQYLKPLIPKITDKNEVNRVISTALFTWCFFIPIMFVTAATVCVLSSRYFTLEQGVSNSIYICVLLFLNLYTNSLIEICDAVYVGLNRSYISKIIQSIYVLGSNIIFVLVCYLFNDLIYALFTNFISIVACLFVFLFFISFNFPWIKIARGKFREFKLFFANQKWYLLWSVCEKLLLSGEIVLIGFLIGPESAAIFTFSAFIMQFCLSVSIMAGHSAMPTISSLLSRNFLFKANYYISKSLTEVIVFAGFFVFFILSFNSFFVNVWVGDEFYFGNQSNAIYVLSGFLLVILRFFCQVHDLTLLIKRRVLVFLASFVVFILLANFNIIEMDSVDSIMLAILILKLPVLLMVLIDLRNARLKKFWKSSHTVFLAVIVAFLLVNDAINNENVFYLSVIMFFLFFMTGLYFVFRKKISFEYSKKRKKL